MSAIPPELNQRLRETLARCGPFASDQELHVLFTDTRIAPWQHVLPQARSISERVQLVIDILADKYDSSGNNALILFLYTLSETIGINNNRYRQLHQLVQELEREISPLTDAQLAQSEAHLEDYLRGISQSYGYTQIFGQPEPVSLDDIYTDVYLLDKPSAFRRFDIRQLQRDPDLLASAKHARISTNVISTDPIFHRLFILGKPGAGKTTLLKHLVLQAATGKSQKIPIFISLGEWAESGLDLLPFVSLQFESCGVPNASGFTLHLLKQMDNVLLLFDGLDAIRQENVQRTSVIRVLRSFSQRFPRVQIIITCRIAATDYTFEDFTYVEIADFSTKQIEVFVRKWFHRQTEKAEHFLEELTREEHRGLREIARQPLLLAMLCLAFNDFLAFPTRRVDLYQDALDALLRKWDSSRSIRRDVIYRDLSTGRKRQLFAHIAAQTFEAGEFFFPQERLEKLIVEYLATLPGAFDRGNIDGAAILRTIEAQHGILVERARHIYSFVHVTFQEYYTALYIVEHAAQGTLPRLLTHIHENRWHEVILLTASLLDNADDLFANFLQALDAIIKEDAQLVDYLAREAYQVAAIDIPPKPPIIRGLSAWFTRFSGGARTTKVRLDLDDLHNALSLLAKSEKTTSEAWRSFATQLQATMRTPHEQYFSDEQITTLKRYLAATELLNHCLDVAYVADRATIESQLLVLPTLEPSPSILIHQAQQFFQAAGFNVIPTSDPTSFTCEPQTAAWQHKFSHPPILKVFVDSLLDGSTVGTLIAHVTSPYLFILINQTPSDDVWLGIADAFRTRDKHIVLIDDTFLIDGREAEQPYRILEKHLRRSLGRGSDLYEAHGPVADSANFFGRESLVTEIRAELTKGRAVALLGLRKMGKSSLFRYLHNKLPFPTAMVDLEATGNDLRELFQAILIAWAKSVRVKKDLAWSPPTLADASDSLSAFIAATNDLFAFLQDQETLPQIGLLLDEAEILLPNNKSELMHYLTFARIVRGLAQKHDCSLALLMAGVDPFFNRNNRLFEQQNPLCQFFQEIYIPPLQPKDCIQMVRSIGSQMGLKYDDKAVDFVVEISGGHPYFARQLCSKAFQRLERQGYVPYAHLRETALDFIRDPATAANLDERGLWGEISAPGLWSPSQVIANQTILKSLARTSPQSETDLLSQVPDRRVCERALDELSWRFILSKSPPDLYAIQIPLFQNWIIRYQLEGE